MGIIRKVQNNFTTGLISDGVLARYDIDKYNAGCRELKNALVRAQGGVYKRPGSRQIKAWALGSLPDLIDSSDNKPLLIPFQYGDNESYVLMFSDEKIRIFYDGGPLLSDDGEIITIDTPYKLKDLPSLKFIQSADVIFLVHKDYAVRKLSRFGHTTWSLNEQFFKPEVSFVVSDLTATNGCYKNESGTVGSADYQVVSTDTVDTYDINSNRSDWNRTVEGSAGNEYVKYIEYCVSCVDNEGSETPASECLGMRINTTWPEGGTIRVSWKAPRTNVKKFSGFLSPSVNGTYHMESTTRFVNKVTGTVFERLAYTVGDITKYFWVFYKGDKPNVKDYPGCTTEILYSQPYASATAAGTIDTLPEDITWTSGAFTEFWSSTIPAYFLSGFALQNGINVNGYYYSDSTNRYRRNGSKTLYLKVKNFKLDDGVKKTSWVVSSSSATSTSATSSVSSTIESGACLVSESFDYANLPLPEEADFWGYDSFKDDRNNWPDSEYEIGSVAAVAGSSTQTYTAMAFDIADGASCKKFFVYKSVNGQFGYVGAVEKKESNASTYVFIDDNIAPDYSQGLKNYNDPFGVEEIPEGDSVLEPYSYSDNLNSCPGAVGIYQQRLILAGTHANPQTVWLSEAGAFNSFAEHEPLIDSDGIEVTMDSRVINEIKHIVSLKETIIFTTGAEYQFGPGRNNDAVTPSSVRFDLQSYWGCTDVPPLTVGDCILFVTNTGKNVRDFQYKYTENGYVGSDVSILADDILNVPIKDWCVQNKDQPVVWICLENGKLLSFTYLREQEVFAWAQHDVNSKGKCKVLSLCKIKEQGKDYVYALRHWEEGNVISLDRMVHWANGDDTSEYCFLESAIELEVTSKTMTVPPQNYVNNNCCIYCEGESYAPEKILVEFDENGDFTSAEINFPDEVLGKTVLIGTPYEMLVETVDPEISTETAVAIGDKRRVAEVSLMLRETYEVEVGANWDKMERVKLPNPVKYGEIAKPFTGIVNVPIQSSHGLTAQCCVKSTLPLPCTVLAISSKVDIG